MIEIKHFFQRLSNSSITLQRGNAALLTQCDDAFLGDKVEDLSKQGLLIVAFGPATFNRNYVFHKNLIGHRIEIP